MVVSLPVVLSTGATLFGYNPFVILFDTFVCSGGTKRLFLRIFTQAVSTMVIIVGGTEGFRVAILFLIFILYPAAFALKSFVLMNILFGKSLQHPLYKSFLHKYYQIQLVLMRVQYDFMLPASFFIQLVGKWLIAILFLMSIRLEGTNVIFRMLKLGAGLFSALMFTFAFITGTAASGIALNSLALIQKWRKSLHTRDAAGLKMSRARRENKIPSGLFGFCFYGFDRSELMIYMNDILELIVNLMIYFS